jgi:hypothetical protein
VTDQPGRPEQPMSGQPVSGHVDLATLADVEEGIAGTAVEVATRTHLDACAQCRDRLTRLRTTRALLTTLPSEPMPDDVRARVDAALDGAGEERTGTVVPMARRGRAWNNPAIAGVAAAVAVVVLIGALVAGNVIHRNGNGNESASTSSPLAGAGKSDAGGSAATTKEWATGTTYTAATIATLVPRIVVGTPPSPVSNTTAQTAPTPQPATATGFTQEQLRDSPAAVAACGTVLADGVATRPVAVDFASFDGKPAVVFALPAAAHPTLLDVWVVRSTCGSSSLDLYFQRIPRPRAAG